MRGNVQVVVVLVTHLLAFCTHFLHPCDSKHVRSPSLTPDQRYSTEIHKLPVLKPNEASKPLIPEMLSVKPQNGWLGHRRLTKPSKTTSQQLVLQPQLKSNTTTKPLANSELSLVKGNSQLTMRQNLRTIAAIKSMAHKLRLRLSRLHMKGQTFPIRPTITAVRARLPARAARLPLNPGTSKISGIHNSRPDQLPIKPDKGNDIVPLTPNDIRMILKRKGWCKKRSFKQKIHHNECEPVFIKNSLCFGQCLSFFIPRKFESCASCRANSVEVVEVQLKCPGKVPGVITKKVDIVKSCRCQATSCSL